PVVINYVGNADAARRVADEVKASGSDALAIRADVSKEADVEAMFAEVQRAWAGIDILVSNAGLQRDAAVTEMTLEHWNTVIGVNLTGAFLCGRAAARAMIRQGVRAQISRAAGKIVYISSVHEIIPWAGHVNYAASDDADYVHGQTIVVDGGMTLYPEFARGG